MATKFKRITAGGGGKPVLRSSKPHPDFLLFLVGAAKKGTSRWAEHD